MKKLYLLGATLASGVVLATASAAPVFAWHPKGQIKKSVQNQTSNSALSDANDAKTAVTAKTGDTLKYVIEVSNVGDPASNGYNDMANTIMTDTLPAGVELVSNPAQRTISENLGTLKPGQKVTKEYIVRVTVDKDKTVVTNKACFTGNSTVNDNPQSGCDNAVVAVTVPEQPKGGGQVDSQPAVTELPHTGPADAIGIFAGVSSLGYAAHYVVSRKRQ